MAETISHMLNLQQYKVALVPSYKLVNIGKISLLWVDPLYYTETIEIQT